jgi:uncharacterized membrane protein YjgN (DUF898 family)
MSAIDLPTTLGGPAHAGGIVRFVGRDGDYWRLLIRGNILVAVTAGIYRFWLNTDMRRFLWANTVIGGGTLEYTGRGIELFLGFLIAIAVLVPIYVVVFGVSLVIPGLPNSSAGIMFVVLLVLGHFAIYRARRYRLTRTIFRDVRFHQSGSAWSYAFRSVGWWLLIFLTLGLAYPWAQASLDRYRMRHTFYGDLPGRFAGSGTALFLRGGALWLILFGPVLAMLARVPSTDWSLFTFQVLQAGVEAIPVSGPTVSGFLYFTALWIPLVGALLFPALEAITMRWWLSGVRFGDIAVTSLLKKRSLYGIYLRYILASILFFIVAGIVVAIGFGIFRATMGSGAAEESRAAQILAVAAGVIAYIVFLPGSSIFYQAIVKLALWQAAVESLDISNFHMVELVKAEGKQSSPFGEGLADAKNR